MISFALNSFFLDRQVSIFLYVWRSAAHASLARTLSWKEENQGSIRNIFVNSKIRKNRSDSVWSPILKVIFKTFKPPFTFSHTTNGSKIGLFRNGICFNLKIWWMGTIFFRFEKYLYMVCLKIAHLGRVAYCFETLLFLCKLVSFDYSHFHKNIRLRQKRFLSKQGQPWAAHSIEG